MFYHVHVVNLILLVVVMILINHLKIFFFVSINTHIIIDNSFNLLDHRRQSVRILHEFLLREKIIQRTLNNEERQKTNEEKKADRQYLYRHLTECSVAIQLLLNCSPEYWSFIPMNHNEANEEDQKLGSTDFEQYSGWSARERTDEEVEWCLANISTTIDGTRFSQLQLHQQRLFFKQGYDLLILPHRHLDIFNLSLVFMCKSINKMISSHVCLLVF